MLSSRVPRDAAPNAWARRLAELRSAGAELCDLTEANPTRTGLSELGELERAALTRALGTAYQPDARGLPAARAAVAGYYESRALAVDAEHLVLTTGTSESYAHLFRLLADPGDSILVPAPSYPLFEPLAALEGIRIRSFPLAWDGRWHLDLDALSSAMSGGARAVVTVQPNHPTGTCLEARELAALEDLCVRHDAAIIADEVFGDFAWESRPHGLPSLVGERRARTFVLSGLSKVCGLPQLKLGWIWAGGPAAERERALAGLEWIADLFLSVAGPVQLALPALLDQRRTFTSRTLDRVARNRARLSELVKRCPALSALRADGGWVACLRLPSRCTEEVWALALLERGLIVHPGHFYDFGFGPDRRRQPDRPARGVRARLRDPGSRARRVLARRRRSSERASRVLQQQDLAEVPGEVLVHVIDRPARLDLAHLAVRPRALRTAREIGIAETSRNRLEMPARAGQQVVIEREILAGQHRRRGGILGERHAVVIAGQAEQLLDLRVHFGRQFVFEDQTGPPHLDDRLMCHQHADGVHAARRLPRQIFGGELARGLVLAARLIVHLRDERSHFGGGVAGWNRERDHGDFGHGASGESGRGDGLPRVPLV